MGRVKEFKKIENPPACPLSPRALEVVWMATGPQTQVVYPGSHADAVVEVREWARGHINTLLAQRKPAPADPPKE